MWLCCKVMATRSPPSVSESQGRGLDVRAELKNHLVRHWVGSGSVAAWQWQKHRHWGAWHGPGRMGGCTVPALLQQARATPGSPMGHHEKAASQTAPPGYSPFGDYFPSVDGDHAQPRAVLSQTTRLGLDPPQPVRPDPLRGDVKQEPLLRSPWNQVLTTEQDTLAALMKR